MFRGRHPERMLSPPPPPPDDLAQKVYEWADQVGYIDSIKFQLVGYVLALSKREETKGKSETEKKHVMFVMERFGKTLRKARPDCYSETDDNVLCKIKESIRNDLEGAGIRCEKIHKFINHHLINDWLLKKAHQVVSSCPSSSDVPPPPPPDDDTVKGRSAFFKSRCRGAAAVAPEQLNHLIESFSSFLLREGGQPAAAAPSSKPPKRDPRATMARWRAVCEAADALVGRDLTRRVADSVLPLPLPSGPGV